MASIKPLTQMDRRPLSGANRSREPIAFAAESDPLGHWSRDFSATQHVIPIAFVTLCGKPVQRSFWQATACGFVVEIRTKAPP
jgi:hypothetical protein